MGQTPRETKARRDDRASDVLEAGDLFERDLVPGRDADAPQLAPGGAERELLEALRSVRERVAHLRRRFPNP